MQQRYYDPVAGRFLSIDPVVTDVSSAGSFNRYYYANNNPFGYIDSDGRESEPTTVTIVGQRGAAAFAGWLASLWHSQIYQSSKKNDDLSIQPGCGCGASAGASGIPPDDDDDPRGRSRSSSRKRSGYSDKAKRISNPKHHKNSVSPEPPNVDELYENSVADQNGVRWAKDTEGTIHRFSKPSNGETHWNGSTSGVDPFKKQNIPVEIRRILEAK
jgi:uncharacterized protein RhaS with RHS repeats